MPEPAVIEIPRTHNPFPRHGIRVDEQRVPGYAGPPDSLIALLKSKVDAAPDVEAVVELDGERLTYRQLWNRSARVPGGLRAAGMERGDRVAVRYPAGVNWALAFWGTVMSGGVAVAVNTRSSEPEVEAALAGAPGVLEAAVLAVPDEVMGEKVGAVLYGGDCVIDVAKVLAHCREQLAGFKIPQYVVLSGRPLPRNPGGKVLKGNLRNNVTWGDPLR